MTTNREPVKIRRNPVNFQLPKAPTPKDFGNWGVVKLGVDTYTLRDPKHRQVDAAKSPAKAYLADPNTKPTDRSIGL